MGGDTICRPPFVMLVYMMKDAKAGDRIKVTEPRSDHFGWRGVITNRLGGCGAEVRFNGCGTVAVYDVACLANDDRPPRDPARWWRW